MLAKETKNINKSAMLGYYILCVRIFINNQVRMFPLPLGLVPLVLKKTNSIKRININNDSLLLQNITMLFQFCDWI